MTVFAQGQADEMAEEKVPKQEPMSEEELMALVADEIDRAKEFTLGTIGKERATAYDYYYGRKYGNEEKGRSQVISHDVAQQVDSALPALVKMFAGSDKAVEFVARKGEDVAASEQATELCNYIFYTQNNGFLLMHDAIKNALLQKTGCFKWYWDESIKVSEETYEGLSGDELQMLLQDPMVEIVAMTPGEAPQIPQQPGMPPQPPVEMFDVTVRKKDKSGKAKVCVIPPDELLVSDACSGMEADDQPAITHRCEKTLSDLAEMGYDVSTLLELASEEVDTMEDASRRERTGDYRKTELADPMLKKVWYCETYIKIDFDRDGIAERRKVCSVGSKMLHNEMIDHVPMSFGTTKIMPHEFFGVSMADEVMDLQLLKSTLWRQSMDNIYLSNTPRMGVDKDRVNLDDVMTVRMGGLIRTEGPPGQSLSPITVPFVAGNAFQMIEYVDAEEETRTGVSRLMQGIDPNTLNKTATGVNTLMNAAQARIELVARGLAETLIKPMFQGLMYLLSKHQHEALTVRLRNQYVPIDPRAWTTDYDMTVNVGLGVGTKDQQLQHLMAIEQAQAGIAQSPYGRLVDEQKVYNLQAKKSELAGFKDASQFFNDPKSLPPPQPPPPPPEMMKVQAQIQADQQKQQAEMAMKGQEMQMDQQARQQEMQMDFAARKMEAMLDMQIEMFKAKLHAAMEEKLAILHPPQPQIPGASLR